MNRVEIIVSEDRTVEVMVNGNLEYQIDTPDTLSIECKPHILRRIEWTKTPEE